jgi:GlpG protein
MRMIGQLQDEDQAKRFGAFLYGRGIDNQVDEGHAGGWEIWVLDDTRLDEAADYLRRFKEDPNDPIFTRQTKVAVTQRQRQEAKEAPRRTRVIDARTAFYRSSIIPHGAVTIALIAICVIVFLMTKGGDDFRAIRPLFITQPEYRFEHRIALWQSLPEVFHGQVWRLLTPIFVHFGIPHILFNMWVLRDFGSIIEARRGKIRFLALVLATGVLSNVAQYVVDGPVFGGMSGVLYGLLCYMWMQGKFNPASELALHPTTVQLMMAWFVLCLVGVIPNVANTAHATGAIVGGLWGYIGARWATRYRR